MQDVKVSKTYKAEEVWEAITGSGFANMNYWVSGVELDTWRKPCEITFTHDTKEGGDYKKTTITPDQLGEAFAKACQAEWVHCSGYAISDLENQDACTADLVCQMAIFGELVFG
jgi:hypothetical protein